MRKELAKTYDPKSFEDRIYQFWMDGGYFTAERDPENRSDPGTETVSGLRSVSENRKSPGDRFL